MSSSYRPCCYWWTWEIRRCRADESNTFLLIFFVKHSVTNIIPFVLFLYVFFKVNKLPFSYMKLKFFVGNSEHSQLIRWGCNLHKLTQIQLTIHNWNLSGFFSYKKNESFCNNLPTIEFTSEMGSRLVHATRYSSLIKLIWKRSFMTA